MKRWLCLLLLAGCGGDEPDKTGGGPDILKGIVTKDAPDGSAGLLDEINKGPSEAEVTVVGKIGDMMAGFAAFRLVDLSLQD